jgi:lipopolysaccharide transport system ATP-binding protein
MGNVSKQGRTIVFVSHNMTALQKLCTRVVWLDGGKVMDTGDPRKVIDHYLQTNAVANLESLWEDNLTAPGDERVRLRSVRVIPQSDPGEPITVHTPLRIEFTYCNYVPGTVLNVSMLLNNLEEVCVFATASDFAPRPAGLIRHIVEIPGDFLNAGSYYVNMLIVKDASTGILFQNNVVAFEVVEGEVVGNWYGQFPGTVRPKLKWASEVVESRDSIVSTTKDR